MLPSELKNTIELSSVCTFIEMKHISPTFMYIIYNVFEAANIYKTLPQMSFHLYFLLFLFRSGAPPMTLLTAGVRRCRVCLDGSSILGVKNIV